MLKPFVSAVTEKIIKVLAENEDFFDLDKEKRMEYLHNKKFPHSFKFYLILVKADEFLDDLKVVEEYLRSSKSDIKDNKFFESVCNFFIKELAPKIDHLDGEYYLLDKSHRQTIVDKLINSHSHLAEELKKLLLNFSYEQLSSEIRKLSQEVKDSPYVLVQTPREIEIELKREIREKIQEEEENCFPIFQVNHKLIGGVRIFIDGKTKDHSWRSRVHELINLTR